MSIMIRWKSHRTRYELLKLREQLELARKAHTLLEEKYKVLMQEAQHIRGTILPFQEELTSKVEKAYTLLSEATISLGLRNVYRAALSSRANDDIEIRWTTIRGVSSPQLVSKIRKRAPLERGYGLASTNHLLDEAAEAFEDTLISLVEVAELDNILRIIEREIETTGIRASALEKVLIPSLKNEIKMIENRLEENERERHTVIKWIKERRPEIL